MEILTNLQRKILIRFSELPDKEAFYLTGGTALSAFFLKHRRSNDLDTYDGAKPRFLNRGKKRRSVSTLSISRASDRGVEWVDFFTNVEELILPLSQKLEASLKKEGLKVERLRGFHSFVELSVNSDVDSTVVHFAFDSPFRFEQPSNSEEIPGIKVDSLIDIATNKLLALFGRAELRDFLDIYFLIKERYSKNELIEKSAQKDPGFDLYWLGVAMERINDFSDDSPDLHLLTRPCRMSELKEFFSNWRKDILKEITERG